MATFSLASCSLAPFSLSAAGLARLPAGAVGREGLLQSGFRLAPCWLYTGFKAGRGRGLDVGSDTSAADCWAREAAAPRIRRPPRQAPLRTRDERRRQEVTCYRRGGRAASSSGRQVGRLRGAADRRIAQPALRGQARACAGCVNATGVLIARPECGPVGVSLLLAATSEGEDLKP